MPCLGERSRKGELGWEVNGEGEICLQKVFRSWNYMVAHRILDMSMSARLLTCIIAYEVLDI